MDSQEEQWLLEEKYKGEKSEGFFTDLERLKAGEPLAYVIGHAPFLGTTIYLDSHPLIPRPETEYWVEKAINEIKRAAAAAPQPLKILDLCAGSGAIGIAIAKAIPEVHIHFTEIDKAHLPTIGKNLEANDIPCTRYKVFQSDLFENIEGQYDFILSNPPYIDPKLDRTETSVKDYEPHLALYGGEEGLELIKKILKAVPSHMSDDCILYIEHEPEQATVITSQAEQNNLRALTYTDQYGLLRYTRLKKKTS